MKLITPLIGIITLFGCGSNWTRQEKIANVASHRIADLREIKTYLNREDFRVEVEKIINQVANEIPSD